MRVSLFILITLLVSPIAGQSETETSSASDPIGSTVSNASVRLAVIPTYPPRALRKKIDGKVTVAFTISRYGRAINPKIVEASPKRVFNNVTLDALRFWAFEPARPVNCGTVEQSARQTFRFKHDAAQPIQLLPITIEGLPTVPRENRHASLKQFKSEQQALRSLSQVVSPRGLIVVDRVEPQYPEKALYRRAEGVVSISFLIGTDGSVVQPKVVDAVRGSLFSGPAMRALKQWRFEPKLRDGVPVEAVGCHEFLFLVDEFLQRQQELKRQGEGVQTFDPS